jgi:hypothetical protein
MAMKQNVGKVDKIIRVILAAILTALGYYLKLWWIYIFAAIFLITALVGFCGLYPIFGINTSQLKKDKKARKK